MSNFKPGERVAATTTITGRTWEGEKVEIKPGDLGTIKGPFGEPLSLREFPTVYEVNFDDSYEPYSGAGAWIALADELEVAP